ncbi:MAG: hypothetical protein RIR43_2085 [Pseudomonadota bacterium]|jgi:chromosome segregation ATPase
MANLDDLARRVEHLLVRHAELQRTQQLLQQQVVDLTAERDAMKQKLVAARTRLDALIARVPEPALNTAPEGLPAADPEAARGGDE